MKSASFNGVASANRTPADSSTARLMSFTKVILLANVLFVVANMLVLHGLVALEKKTVKERSDNHKGEFQGGRLTKKQSSLLYYGLEIAFLFPIEIYDDPRDLDDRKIHLLWKLVDKLEQVGIPAIVGDRSTTSLSSWKLILERQGFEAASPLSPSYDQIERLMTVIRGAGYMTHPEMGAMHINVDARNRTLQETANVYKNAMAVEQALDLIRSPPRFSEVSGKAKSLIEPFNASLLRGYASMDASETFSSHIVLGQTADDEFHSRHRYKVGLKIKQEDEHTNITMPSTFEFRGLEASLDPSVTVAWLKLTTKFIAESYAGNVLAPINRTVDEAWSELFGQLIQNDDLEAFFHKHRETMHIDPPDRDNINMRLCRHLDTYDKYLEALHCPKRENATGSDDDDFVPLPPVPTQNSSHHHVSLTTIEDETYNSTPSC